MLVSSVFLAIYARLNPPWRQQQVVRVRRLKATDDCVRLAAGLPMGTMFELLKHCGNQRVVSG